MCAILQTIAAAFRFLFRSKRRPATSKVQSSPATSSLSHSDQQRPNEISAPISSTPDVASYEEAQRRAKAERLRLEEEARQAEEAVRVAAEREQQRKEEARREAERLRLEEEARQAEAARQAEEAARIAAEQERQRKEEEARREAERLRLEEEDRQAEAARQAEEAARIAAEQERQRKEEEARREVESLRLEEEARQAEAARQAEEAARLAAEQERQRKEEEARGEVESLRLEEEARQAEAARQAEEAARTAAEQERQRKVAEEERTRAAAEVETRRQAEEAARLAIEAEAKRKAEEEERARGVVRAKVRRGTQHKRARKSRSKVSAEHLRKPIDEAQLAAQAEARRRRATEEASLKDERGVQGALRLCARLDLVAGASSFTLRATMNRDFPDAELILKEPDSGETFLCEGDVLHWSTPLRYTESGARADGARFDWGAGVEMRDERLGWRFRLHGRPIRLFRSGEEERLPGLVEVSRLLPSVPFVIAARRDCWQTLEAWGETCCDGFKRLRMLRGVPDCWGLYSAAAAHSDEPVRSEFPSLAFSDTVRLLLRGGLHTGAGSVYFHFSLPIVLMDGGAGYETVRCNTIEIQSDGGIYHLPQNLPIGKPICLEAIRAGRVLQRRWFTISDDFDWQWNAPIRFFNRLGSPIHAEQEHPVGVVGAALHGIPPATHFINPPESCFEQRPARGTRCRWSRVFFVGSIPGQIVSWPRESLPTEWAPMWAIPMKRRGRIHFCSANPGSVETAGANAASYRAERVRLWKRIVYHRRRKVAPPSTANLRRLWRQFSEEARRVRA